MLSECYSDSRRTGKGEVFRPISGSHGFRGDVNIISNHTLFIKQNHYFTQHIRFSILIYDRLFAAHTYTHGVNCRLQSCRGRIPHNLRDMREL